MSALLMGPRVTSALTAAVPSLLAAMSSSAQVKARRGVERLGLMKGEGSTLDFDEKCLCKYSFKNGSRNREVSLAHSDGVWHVKVDSEIVGTKTHNNSFLRSFCTFLDFPIPPIGTEGTIMATVTMEWVPRSAKWLYTLTVNGVVVPECWSKTKGTSEDPEAPDVSMKSNMATAMRTQAHVTTTPSLVEDPEATDVSTQAHVTTTPSLVEDPEATDVSTQAHVTTTPSLVEDPEATDVSTQANVTTTSRTQAHMTATGAIVQI